MLFEDLKELDRTQKFYLAVDPDQCMFEVKFY